MCQGVCVRGVCVRVCVCQGVCVRVCVSGCVSGCVCQLYVCQGVRVSGVSQGVCVRVCVCRGMNTCYTKNKLIDKYK